MYCVIQELQRKKPDTNGAYKELTVFTNPFNIKDAPQYGYCFAGEKFERPIRTAYKISVHESKRANGVVTKKQFVVTTVGYYDFSTDWFALGDYGERIMTIAEKLNTDAGTVYDIIDKKVSPLQQGIKVEFEQTEEYRTSAKHKEIIKLYRKEKALFSQMYGCPEAEYEYCFNVFGELMNKNYYEIIINKA
jgi:hypothetical protein